MNKKIIFISLGVLAVGAAAFFILRRKTSILGGDTSTSIDTGDSNLGQVTITPMEGDKQTSSSQTVKVADSAKKILNNLGIKTDLSSQNSAQNATSGTSATLSFNGSGKLSLDDIPRK